MFGDASKSHPTSEGGREGPEGIRKTKTTTEQSSIQTQLTGKCGKHLRCVLTEQLCENPPLQEEEEEGTGKKQDGLGAHLRKRVKSAEGRIKNLKRRP